MQQEHRNQIPTKETHRDLSLLDSRLLHEGEVQHQQWEKYHLLIHLPVCHPLSPHHCTPEEHFGLRGVAQYNLDNSLHEPVLVVAAVVAAAAAAVAAAVAAAGAGVVAAAAAGAAAAAAAAAAHVAYKPWDASSCDDSTAIPD